MPWMVPLMTEWHINVPVPPPSPSPHVQKFLSLHPPPPPGAPHFEICEVVITLLCCCCCCCCCCWTYHQSSIRVLRVPSLHRLDVLHRNLHSSKTCGKASLLGSYCCCGGAGRCLQVLPTKKLPTHNFPQQLTLLLHQPHPLGALHVGKYAVDVCPVSQNMQIPINKLRCCHC